MDDKIGTVLFEIQFQVENAKKELEEEILQLRQLLHGLEKLLANLERKTSL